MSSLPLTKTDAAYQEIRLAIESGKLEPGRRLLIGELQELLGMSPTPIREALRLLQRDGLVEHTPHYGMLVADFTEDSLIENHRIRSVLEPLATRLATERASDEEIARIRKTHEQFKQAVHDDPAGRRAPRLNTQWHMEIYKASQSPQLVEFIERLWMVMGKTKWLSGHGERSVTEHEAVVEQIEARNADKAARLMGEHLGSIDKMLENRAKALTLARPGKES
jgi:DNA-binding GntR family transcriptional regulator